MTTTSRNMKNQAWKINLHLILKIGLLLSAAAAVAHGMPTTMTSTQGGPRCMDVCKVKNHAREKKSSANCSNKGHHTVPESCYFVEELIMDDNPVRKINATMFDTFHHLAYLRMRNNGISAIEGRSFAYTVLKDIDLSENYLAELNDDVFLNLINLTHLNMKRNRLTEFTNHRLPRLTSLILSENQIQQLHHIMFEGTPNLKNLDLSNNQISELEISFLGRLRNLLFLRLSNNKIATINRKAFEYLQELEELHLDNNSISMNSFQYAEIFSRQRQLKVLNISYNNLDGLHAHMLFHLNHSLEKFSASNNKITSIDGRTFIGFPKLRHIDLTNNKLSANSTEAFQTLVGKRATNKVMILLAGNPICDEYQEEFKDCYNVTVFCNEIQTKNYAAKDAAKDVPNIIDSVIDPAKTRDPEETLTKICLGVAGVLLVVVVVLPIFIWKRYKCKIEAYNLRHTFSNRGYNYPGNTEGLDQAPEQDAPPPPVPERGPNIPLPAEDHEGPYLNGNIGTGTTASYIQPNGTCSSRGRGSCPHHHKSPRRSRSSNRTRPPVYAKSSPDLHRGSPESITIVGTNFGGSCRSMHVTGLPKIKKQWRESMSRHLPGWYTQRFETRVEPPVERRAEANESTYMIRHETEDGRPVSESLDTNTTADKT